MHNPCLKISLISKNYSSVANVKAYRQYSLYRYYFEHILSRLPRKTRKDEDKHSKNEWLDQLEKSFEQFKEIIKRETTPKNPIGSASKPNNPPKNDKKNTTFFQNLNNEIEKEKKHLKYCLLMFLAIISPALYFHNFSKESSAIEISYREFVNNILLKKDLRINSDPLQLEILDNSKVFVDGYGGDTSKYFFYILDSVDFENHLADTLKIHGIDSNCVNISYSVSSLKLTRLGVFLIGSYVWIFARLIAYFLRPSTMPRLVDMAKAKIGTNLPVRAIERKNYVPIKSDKRFNDVIGYKEQKQELIEFVDFLKNPKVYSDIGAKIPRGALLYGPPGTGKTLIAKAVAGEAGVNFFSAAGSEFQQLFIGVGPQRIKDLFEDASNSAPSIIFIDEIDSVAISRARASKQTHNENTATLNQLLALMDGFKTNKEVVVLAATNRFDQLDPAILRPGRFDRHIYFGSPDLESRTAMFKYYLQKTPLEDSIDYISNRMSLMTTGFVGADISLICNEAAIFAARDDSNIVRIKDFERAIDRVIIGSKSSVKLQPHERQIISLRESAKAVMAWFNKDAQPILKVSIVPRGQELAYSQKYIKEEYLTSKQKLDALLLVLLSGRAAEEVILKRLYSVSGEELLKITNLVYKQIGVFGMGDTVKNVSFQSLSIDNGSLFPLRPEYGHDVQNEIDINVKQTISSAYDHCKQLIIKHKDLILKLAKFLYENEQADNKDLIDILGTRPYTDDILRKIDE